MPKCSRNSNKNMPEFRKLEDLNVIDNFLFQQMVSDKEDGVEFVRIMLSRILGRRIRNLVIIPQRPLLGIDTDRHGIRMDAYIQEIPDEVDSGLADVKLIPDIYDIEPNNTYEKESLHKRIRYYHGLVDTQLLSAGVDYAKLPNVTIIVILPYDPFDKKRMVYTFQNTCIEDPSVTYNDGAQKIYLYTKGTAGNPSQELKDMLKYIEKSTKDNVTNQEIATIQKLVEKVKRKKEVGINYMKSWEMEEEARKRGYNAGLEAGFSDGFNDGFNDGFSDGFSDGFNNGKEKVNQLNLLLAQAGRTEDIIKAAADKTYQEKLLLEFSLVE